MKLMLWYSILSKYYKISFAHFNFIHNSIYVEFFYGIYRVMCYIFGSEGYPQFLVLNMIVSMLEATHMF